MRVFRITPEEYANDITGNGAKLYGGRWNNEGIKALYASSSRALALLEVLVHANFEALKNRVYKIIELEVPDGGIRKIEISMLSENWNNDFIQSETLNIGNVFLTENLELVLEVPSVILPDESNYVLNPENDDFSKVKIVSIKTLEIGKRVLDSI
jgi:RES domain-containing protein